MHSVKAPFPMTVVYEFYNVAGPLLSRMVRRGIARDLEQLRKLMEEGGPPPPASPGAPPA
jgi:hypothetical protein